MPHPSTLRKWYGSVDGTPGFTTEALKALKIRVNIATEKKCKLVGALMIDEMMIREQIELRNGRETGRINYGTGFESGDNLSAAKEALVFLFVALNERWKLPIGYFLIHRLNAESKANLIITALKIVHDTGAEVVSVTCDGAANNIAAMNILGANLKWPDLKVSFEHPITKNPVNVIMDPCHMLKLVRNAVADFFATEKKIKHDQDGHINWQYIINIVDIQEKAGVHAATKIRRKHIHYQNEKMKVSLAVQTFSRSVSDALFYCENDLKLDQFKGASATSKFCLFLNNIFDVLNVRNFISKGEYTKPFNSMHANKIKLLLEQAEAYILNLMVESKSMKWVPIVQSSRRVGFLGLIISMRSLKDIYLNWVQECDNDNKPLHFLLSYKLSQDHLEMFFSAIRSRGGFNNNPTAYQFENAYRRLLVHAEICSSAAANCLALDGTSILNITCKNKNKKLPVEILKFNVSDETDDDLIIPGYNTFVNDIVEYISGFVARKVSRGINCEVCASALISKTSDCKLLNTKDRGGLFRATSDVINICKIAERVLREAPDLTRQSDKLNVLIVKATSKISLTDKFVILQEHILNQEPISNHLITLIYYILYNYFIVRLHHQNASLNDTKSRLRKKFTKLIHFRHE